MAMSSYEVVRRAVEFDSPERLPLRFDWLPESTDFRSVRWAQIGAGNHGEKESLDEWGCAWARTETANMGQVIGHPLADWTVLDHYVFPDPERPELYADMASYFEGAEDKYCMTDIFMLLFERLHALRGFEQTLMDLYEAPDRLGWLADKVVDYNLAVIRNIAALHGDKIHGFSFTDDWGTELDTFIHPSLWRSFFQPRYKRIIDACHDLGWHVWMHSCGKINGILEGLIEIGLDAINLQQPQVLGIETIGNEFAGRICFESLCDIQRTLPLGDPQAMREEAALLMHHWSTGKGGFVLSDYGDAAAIGAAWETKQAMIDIFQAQDPWREGAST